MQPECSQHGSQECLACCIKFAEERQARVPARDAPAEAEAPSNTGSYLTLRQLVTSRWSQSTKAQQRLRPVERHWPGPAEPWKSLGNKGLRSASRHLHLQHVTASQKHSHLGALSDARCCARRPADQHRCQHLNSKSSISPAKLQRLHKGGSAYVVAVGPREGSLRTCTERHRAAKLVRLTFARLHEEPKFQTTPKSCSLLFHKTLPKWADASTRMTAWAWHSPRFL